MRRRGSGHAGRPLVLMLVRRAEGGMATHLAALLPAVAAVADVHLVGEAPAWLMAEAQALGFATTPLPLGDDLRPRDLLVAARLRELAAAADVLHAHGLKAALTLVSVGRGRPLLYTAHNLPPRGLRGRLFDALERLVVRVAVCSFAVSHAVAEHLAAQGAPARRVLLLPPLFDPEPFLGVPGPPSTPTLGTLARLEPRKGVELLLEALAHLARAEPGVRLVVGGDGPLAAHLEARARALGVEGRVRFLGRLPRRDLPAFFSDIRLYVQPSLSEGLGLAALEAQAAGRAVVATAVGGLGDTLAPGRTGVLCPPEPEALARAIGATLPEADRMAAEARRHALERSRDARRRAEASFAAALRLAGAVRSAHGGKG